MKNVKKVKKHDYINNKALYEEMCKWLQACKEEEMAGRPKPKASNCIGAAILQIANNLASKRNFSRYSYKDEMISDGIINCLKYMHNFNPEKTKNAFAYFTTIIWNSFIYRIGLEKDQQYLKLKNLELFYITDELVTGDIDSASLTFIDMSYEKSNEFIKEYEQKKAEKKKPRKKGLEVFLEGN